MTTLLFLAGAEIRARWRALVVLGVVTGLVAGSVLGLLAVARRTTTAYDRLRAATAVDDARGMVIGDAEVREALAELPEVEDVWFAPVGVGQVEGPEVTYFGVMGGFGTDAHAPGLTEPVAVVGRLPDPAATDEVAVDERFFREAGYQIGDEFTLKWLTPEEFNQFDTGFGEPDGAEARLRIVGAFRLAGSPASLTGLLGSSAVLDGDPHVVGHAAFVRLRPGATFAEVQEGVAELQVRSAPAAGGEEFVSVEIFDDATIAEAARGSGRVLGGGLAVAAGAVLVAGIVVLGQAWARHSATSGVTGPTAVALGVSRRQRRLARAAGGVLAGTIAGLVAAGGAVVGGVFEPIGDLRDYEPQPGVAVHTGLAVLGGLVVAGATILLAAFATTRQRRTAVVRPGASWWQSLPPPLAVGIAMAVDPAWRRRTAGRGAAFLGVVVAVGGLAGAIVFGASLDQLLDSPSRQGVIGDFRISDVDDETLARLREDPRIGRLLASQAASIEIDGLGLVGHTYEEVRGSFPWELEGRPPATPDEVALGFAAADRLGVGIGDAVVARSPDGDEVPLRVVGVGVIPPAGEETFGLAAAFTSEAFDTVALAQGFTEAVAEVVEGDPGDVLAEYAAEVEASPDEPVGVVADLVELQDLPRGLALALFVLAALALAHPLVVTVRRGADVATLRAVGFTGRQVGTTVLAAALAAAAVALAVGVPLGVVVGRTTWRAVATNAGVLDRPDVAPVLLLVLVAVVLVLAVLVALWPARRAARLEVGPALRSA